MTQPMSKNRLAGIAALLDSEFRTDCEMTQAVDELLAEVERLRNRVADLERPWIERKRAAIVLSYQQLAAQAREDRDYEGAFEVDCRLREREAEWAAEDAQNGGAV